MTLETLKIFVEVVEKGNFANVARDRNIAPSSVSRTITKLEEELGLRLFQRTTRKLQPTEAGMIYYQRVAVIIQDLETANAMAVDMSKNPTGTLKVTASTVFSQQKIIPLLPEFCDRYPSLKISMLLRDSYVDLIAENIDIAIRLGTLEDSSYGFQKLRSLKFYICASREYLEKYGVPEQPEDLTDHNCLLFPRRINNFKWLFKDPDNHITEIEITGKYLLTNSDAIKQCTIASMGISLLPDWLIENEVRSGSLVTLFTDYEVTATDYYSGIWLLYPSREYMPLKTKVFMEFLQEKIGQ